MSLFDMTNDHCVRALKSALEEVKGLNEATQLSLQALLERLGPALALNVQAPLHCVTQPIPAPAGQRKILLKPSSPLDFDGDRSAGKAFLTSCRTYIQLRSEAFDDDLVKIIWAMSYMNTGCAGRWATREFETEAQNGRLRFLDWLDFEKQFQKDFLPLNAEAVAVNTLETTDYFQRSRTVDAYLDQFRDLICDSGYSDPKTIVVKFRRGLDRQISMALAGMPVGRPSDKDPEAWFHLAVQLDQNRAADEAFHGQVQTFAVPLSLPSAPSDQTPTLMVIDPRFDARRMDAAALLATLESRLAGPVKEQPEAKEFLTPRRVARAMRSLANAKPPLPDDNRFSVLEVPELDATPEDPEAQPPPPVEPRTLRKPKWEWRMARKLVIRSLEKDLRCIMVPIHLKTTDTMEEASTEAMVDTGTTGDFVDQDFVNQAKLPMQKLSQPIPVYNVDGTLNEAGSIHKVVDMIMTYDGHSERILLAITRLGKQSMTLGMTWLNKHNPEIDFRAGTVKMTRCLPQCCVGCRTERRDEPKAEKKDVQQVNTCRTGPFPAFVEDADDEDDESYANSEMPTDTESDDPDDFGFTDKPLEEGDRIWATGLFPQTEHVRATT